MKVNYQERIDWTSEELKTLLSQQKSLINRHWQGWRLLDVLCWWRRVYCWQLWI